MVDYALLAICIIMVPVQLIIFAGICVIAGEVDDLRNALVQSANESAALRKELMASASSPKHSASARKTARKERDRLLIRMKADEMRAGK